MTTRSASLLRASLTAFGISVFAWMAIFSLSQPSLAQSGILPSDRDAHLNWQKAGMLSVGGIPNRTTVCTTVGPRGGGQDDTANIQSAIEACPPGQVVQLSAGTFTIAEGSTVMVDRGITLRGAGAGTTLLTRTNGAKLGSDQPGANPSPMIIVGPQSNSYATTTTLASDAVQGSTQLQVTNPTGFAPGQIVQIDELMNGSWQKDPIGLSNQIWAAGTYPNYEMVYPMHNPAWQYDSATQLPTVPNGPGDWFSNLGRFRTEIKQITTISGNTITFDSPLTENYRVSHAAQLYNWQTPHLRNAGVENLSMSNGDNGQLMFQWCAYCWASGIEAFHGLGDEVNVSWGLRVQIEGSYFHNAVWPVPGGGGYNIAIDRGSSEILVENNISRQANKVNVVRAAGAGSVFGYNYMDDGYIEGETWMEMGANGSHLVGSHHVLFEGNWTFNCDNDGTWGSALKMTYFRNWCTGYRTPFTSEISGTTLNDFNGQDGPYRAIGGFIYTYYESFIGNVLGMPGKMSGWVYSDPVCNDGNKQVIFLGWTCYGAGTWVDPNTAATAIVHGNYDYLQNQVTWSPNIANHTLPNSWYLMQRPAFFDAAPGYVWPWVNPTGATQLYTLPAKARYDAGTPFTQPSLKPRVAHDFNGDGLSDVAWRDTSGNAAAWLMNGAQLVQSAPYGTVPTAWSIVGQRDFNGDGMADWLWRDTSGNVAIWFLNGAQLSQSAGVGNVAKAWSVAGTGDFDGDGKGDVLWQDTSGNVAVWFMNGAQATPAGVGAASSGWSIAGTGDFNGDGKTDILWQDNSGNVAIWFMNGVQVTPAGVGAVSTAWSIVGTGDFNGDGKSDILFRDASGNVAIWFMNGVQVTPAGVGAVSTAWSVAETGDYDGDGKSDILWQDTSGNVAVWFMNGAQVTPAGVGAVPTAWSIQGKGAD